MPFASTFLRLPVLFVALAISSVALTTRPAVGQGEPRFYDVPFTYGQWEIGGRFDESQLRYFVDPRDPDWEVAAAIADAIAGALLLQPQRYTVERQFISEDITGVYELLLENCDIHMGFKLIPEGYGDWITLSRAYYQTKYVFATLDTEIASLADLPPGHPIGATVGTSAHIQLASYLRALPADQRWPIYPFGTNDFALNALVEGTVEVSLVWAPALWGAQRSGRTSADIDVIDPDPLPATVIGVGAVMLSNQTYLRTAVDEAIAALHADGTLAQILDDFDFPAV